MKVLLHACCGPCASACVPRLAAASHSVSLFFSNSNIDTRDEFMRRAEALMTLADHDGVPAIVDAYDHAAWLDTAARGYETAPERGARCERCFRYNLSRAAAYAAANGFDAFTTSLTVSPHKPSPLIFSVGASVAPIFLPVDFKKQDGFLCSVRRAKELVHRNITKRRPDSRRLRTSKIA